MFWVHSCAKGEGKEEKEGGGQGERGQFVTAMGYGVC